MVGNRSAVGNYTVNGFKLVIFFASFAKPFAFFAVKFYRKVRKDSRKVRKEKSTISNRLYTTARQ